MKNGIISFLIGFIGVMGPVAVVSAEESGSILPPLSYESEPPVPDTAIVRLDGQPLFQVRGMSGFSAEKRAKAIESRIKSVAENPTISSSGVIIAEYADRSELLAGNVFLAALSDADAATENISRSIMAEGARLNIGRAISRYRQDRSPKVLFRRTIIAAVATLVFLLLLMGLHRFFQRLFLWTDDYVKKRIQSLEERSSQIIQSRPLSALVVGLFKAVRFLLIATLVYFYLDLVLGLYPWTRPLAAQLFSMVINPLGALARKFVSIIPDLIFLTVFTGVVRYVLKITRMFFDGIGKGTLVFKNFESDWAWPTYRIVRLLIICFSLVVAYPYIPGSNSDAFKGVSLFVGVLFSLGSTSFIANMVAGIALTYRRAFRVGDVIKVNDVMGLVTDMRLQTTHLRTLYNEVVVIPNSLPLNSHVINYSTLAKSNGLILHTTVGIGYQTPWRQVEAMLLLAAERTAGLRKDRPPFVRQLALDSFYIQYELGAYCDAPLTVPWVTTTLRKNILDVFNEYGVQIMTPAYEGDPENPKVVSKDQVHAAPGDKVSG